MECTRNKGICLEAMIEHESGSNTMRPSNLLSHLIVKRKRRNDESEASYDAFACHDVILLRYLKNHNLLNEYLLTWFSSMFL